MNENRHDDDIRVTTQPNGQESADQAMGEERASAEGFDHPGTGSDTDSGGEQTGVFNGDQGDENAEIEEVEVLRTELSRLQTELHDTRGQLDEMRDRFLRARADLDNFRRRASTDADRARESGLDSAVLPVLNVYDDLQRALEAASTAEPAQIVPGVRAVLTTLERNLETLDIEAVGNVGDHFDPDLHEALTTVPTDEQAKSETIAQVYQVGFRRGERLIRPARVVVYQGQD